MNDSALRHFSKNPVNLDISRSIFSILDRRKQTFMPGRLVPILSREVLPGDSVKMKFSCLVRSQTPFHPVMDDLFMDVFFYWIPARLTWNHWKEFMMENTASHWAPSVTYTIPQLTAPNSGGNGVAGDTSAPGFAKGTLADYLDVPLRVGNISVSALPFRAYCLVWNEFFRDQNIMDPCVVTLSDSTTGGVNVGNVRSSTSVSWISAYNSYITGTVSPSDPRNSYVLYAEHGAGLLPVCRFHDSFSSALPSPQKGPSVLLPLGNKAPVIDNSTSATGWTPFNLMGITGESGGLPAYGDLAITASKKVTYDPGSVSFVDSSSYPKTYLNLVTDLSSATAASVNQLREAFMMQRVYEGLARSGSRYREFILGFFGVRVPDQTVQVPEYISGKRIPLNMTQVAQTSASSSGSTPQGNTGAYSLTTDSGEIFHKSFTEHGFLQAYVCIRASHSYSQGIQPYMQRKSFWDFYNPKLANAPEQPIFKKTIYATGVSSNDDSVWGYQEAFYDYRVGSSTVCGELRPKAVLPNDSLDVWSYVDNYASAPVLSPGWIIEPAENIARTMTVTDQDLFIGDFLCDGTWARPMPVYSIPGLLDHH